MTLVTAGGSAFADALNLATFFDYDFVACNGPVAVSGFVGACLESGVLGYGHWNAICGGTALWACIYR